MEPMGFEPAISGSRAPIIPPPAFQISDNNTKSSLRCERTSADLSLLFRNVCTSTTNAARAHKHTHTHTHAHTHT
eukprot:9497694-Pyramimonas_sp.AAC.2